ncbi:MAG TPA: tetratricopeptide repeat protein [Syntrophobacteraceae bacterium]|nr:tetratricopeptide repeat protein [Syntrophobacteraceae bacterium]
MTKFKSLPGLLLAWCIIAGIALPWCEAAEKDNSETTIRSLRLSVKGNHTRLIFDAEGAKPKAIGPPSADGISVFFSRIIAKLPDKVFKDAKAAAKEVKFRRESGFFEVLFREKDTSVSSTLKEGKEGKYTLCLELTPPEKTADSRSDRTDKSASRPSRETRDGRSGDVRSRPLQQTSAGPVENAGGKVQQLEIRKVETAELFGSKVSPQVKNALGSASSGAGPRNESHGLTPLRSPGAAAANPPQPGIPARDAKPGESSSAPVSKPRDFVEPDESGLELYKSANEKFEDCSRNLVFCASEIIEAYQHAMAAGPRSAQAPLAIYRSALARSAMGDYAKADTLYREVVSNWPDNPVTCRCWLGIGDVFNRRQAYLEAMEAFRWALRGAEAKEDKAAAYYELGRMNLTLGASKEALETLENCVAQQPDYYTKKPDLYRFIGEAQFALSNIEKSKEHLLRYANYQQSAPDQDIVLAKIAEIFLIQGDLGAAGRMYTLIGKYYTDSEGDLICKVRRAELMEKDNLEQAITIYDDLRGKDLSPNLRRIVLMKLAALNAKKGDLAHSLDLMDEAFPVRKDGSSPGGTTELREKVLSDLISQYFSSKNFIKAVQLHDKYRRVFDSMQSPDTLEQIAESYASLKFYYNALDIYDGLIAKGRKKGDDMLLRCALYGLRLNDSGRSFQFCKLVQSESADLKKSEILGHIFYRDRKYVDAVKHFGKVLQKAKEFEIEEPDSYEAYGCCLHQTKKFDEAIPLLQKALERAKADDGFTRRSILVTLSKCLAEQKEFQKAAEMMETAIGVSIGDQKNEILYEISKLYIQAGRTDKAMESLNRIKTSEDAFWVAVAQQQINTIDMSSGKNGGQ